MKNKEGFNYKLINLSFFVFIIYLLYKINFLSKILDLLIIIFLSFSLAFIIYPIYKKANNKILGIIFIYGVIITILLFILYLIIPNSNLINNIIDLLNNIVKFINTINIKYNLNINIDTYINKIINYFINNSIFIIKNIINFISESIIIAILSICILFNIDNFKNIISNKKIINLIFNINKSLNNYIIANIKILIIQFVEYTILFKLIDHPNYILLGLLNSLNTFIPIIGTIISNTIAILTASVISTKLLILTAIISIVFPNIDAYIITPKIYKNTNKISQTLSITSIILGGYLFGFYGIIFSIPILIIIIEILKYKNIVKNSKNVI